MKSTMSTDMSIATRSTGRISDKGETPAALTAVISWSPESLPKDIRQATSTAIGIDRESIQAKFRTKISRTVEAGSPLESTLSRIFTKKSTTNKNVMPKRAAKKGPICSFKT